jgi:PIN domain
MGSREKAILLDVLAPPSEPGWRNGHLRNYFVGIGLAGKSRPSAGTVEAYLGEVSSRVAVRPITCKIAALADQFSTEYSCDPCDRLIGATAPAEGMVLITKDTKIRNCKQLHTLWYSRGRVPVTEVRIRCRSMDSL